MNSIHIRCNLPPLANRFHQQILLKDEVHRMHNQFGFPLFCFIIVSFT